MPRSQPDHLVDAKDAAAYIARLTGKPCAAGTIRSAATRGHIGRHGRRGRNTLYDLREIHRWVTGEDPGLDTG